MKGGSKMTIHNKKIDRTCLACLESGGCVVADTFFEGSGIAVIVKCNCGGVSKYSFKAWGAEHISGKRKKLYRETRED